MGIILYGTDLSKQRDERILMEAVSVIKNEFNYKIGNILNSFIKRDFLKLSDNENLLISFCIINETSGRVIIGDKLLIAWIKTATSVKKYHNLDNTQIF